MNTNYLLLQNLLEPCKNAIFQELDHTKNAKYTPYISPRVEILICIWDQITFGINDAAIHQWIWARPKRLCRWWGQKGKAPRDYGSRMRPNWAVLVSVHLDSSRAGRQAPRALPAAPPRPRQCWQASPGIGGTAPHLSDGLGLPGRGPHKPKCWGVLYLNMSDRSSSRHWAFWCCCRDLLDSVGFSRV